MRHRRQHAGAGKAAARLGHRWQRPITFPADALLSKDTNRREPLDPTVFTALRQAGALRWQYPHAANDERLPAASGYLTPMPSFAQYLAHAATFTRGTL